MGRPSLRFVNGNFIGRIDSLKFSDKKVSTLDDVMVHTRGNMTRAGEILGVNRGTIRKIYTNKIPNVVMEIEEDGMYEYRLLWSRS